MNKILDEVDANVGIGLETFIKALPAATCIQFADRLLTVVAPIALVSCNSCSVNNVFILVYSLSLELCVYIDSYK